MAGCLTEIWDSITYFFKGVFLLGPKFSDALVHRVFFVMQAYLTNVWRISFTRAAAIMNFWEGLSLVLPALFQFLADEVLGNFTVAIISTLFSTAGIGMVALSVPSILKHYAGRCPVREAYSCLDGSQEALFYTGMVLTALGRAGISFSLDALRDDQQSGAKGSWLISSLREGVDSYIKFGFSVDKLIIHAFGSFFILVFFTWIKNWKLLFGIPAIYVAYLTVVFLCGCFWFKHPGPKGSPLTSVCKILYAAATSKRRFKTPITDEDYQKPFFDRFPRCLDRVLPAEHHDPDNRETFDPKKVEIVRFFIGMIPISMTFIFCGVVSSIGNTYFVEQANHMNRRIGSWNVPLLALQLLVTLFRTSHDIYMWALFECKDCIRRCIRIDFSIIGIGMAMTYSILCCITAAKMETKRLGIVRSHDLVGKSDDMQVPMHVAWLLIQFYLLAGLDSCFRKSVKEFYKDRAPQELKDKLESCFWKSVKEFFTDRAPQELKDKPDDDEAAMRYLEAAVDFVSGLGFLCSVLSVHVFGKFSDWFRYTLNESRLDRYYWWLAGVSAVNYVLYLVLVVSGYILKPRRGSL